MSDLQKEARAMSKLAVDLVNTPGVNVSWNPEVGMQIADSNHDEPLPLDVYFHDLCAAEKKPYQLPGGAMRERLIFSLGFVTSDKTVAVETGDIEITAGAQRG